MLLIKVIHCQLEIQGRITQQVSNLPTVGFVPPSPHSTSHPQSYIMLGNYMSTQNKNTSSGLCLDPKLSSYSNSSLGNQRTPITWWPLVQVPRVQKDQSNKRLIHCIVSQIYSLNSTATLNISFLFFFFQYLYYSPQGFPLPQILGSWLL